MFYMFWLEASVRAATGKTCRCGSIHHSRTNHRRCPLNPRNRRPTTQNDEPPISRRRTTITESVVESSTDTSTPPPSDTDTDSETEDDLPLSVISHQRNIRVGKRIAKEFDGEIFLGSIIGLPKLGERYYEISYDDGDCETMTKIEVLKSISLYMA